MKKDKKICNSEVLSQYQDQELEPQQAAVVENHIKGCPTCQRALQYNQTIAGTFRERVEETLSGIDLKSIETNVIAAIADQKTSWWLTLQNLIISKRFYVPAAAVVAGLVLLGVFLTPSPSVSGPSAIISSFKGDVGSVMFLETPKSHQTVIWFNEPLSPNGQNNGTESSAILGSPAQPVTIA
jgi:anti-sigma factor RsiW